MDNDNYLDQLNKFFKLKKQYNSRIDKLKKPIISNTNLTNKERQLELKKIQPKCINCNQIGGTIFSLENNKFRAYCGNVVNPCSLNINIERKKKQLINEKVDEYIQNIKKLKQEIIKIKLDFIFEFISEQESVAKFNETKIKINTITRKIFIIVHGENIQIYLKVKNF